MSNKTETATAPKSSTPKAAQWQISIEQFCETFVAKVTHADGRHTHAFGRTQTRAQRNALKNFNLKYNTQIA